MKIYGLQKMTLLDFPEKVACTVFTGGCNFRCPYCHNFELVDGSAPPVMESEELLRFLNTRKGLLDGVAITGGEPCLQQELPQLIRDIRSLGFKVKLDTNGSFPEMLSNLLESHQVDYVAMDIKNSPDQYAGTIGLRQIDLTNINKSIRILLDSDIDYEFRTTVIDELHSEQSFHDIGSWIRGAARYYLQSFTDRDTVPYGGFHAPSAEKLKQYLNIVSPFVRFAGVRGENN